MELNGLVQNGVIVLTGGLSLPEGTPVVISCSLGSAMPPATQKNEVKFPLVHGGVPGSLNLTNERIAEVLDEEDVASSRC